MALVNLHLSSFNSGELSPLLSDRYEVEKIKSGCRRLRNFLIHVHGPAFRRPGMVHLGPSAIPSLKSSLRPFTFSTSTGFVLEFCPGKLQVWSNGVLVPLDTPVNLPYSEQECRELQLCQVNDVIYIVHASQEPKRLVRRSNTNWTFESIPWKWPPMRDANTGGVTITLSATSGTTWLDSNVPLFSPTHIGSYWEISHRRENAISEIVAPVGAFPETVSFGMRIVGKWELWTYGTWDATLFLERATPYGWEVLRTWRSSKDRNIVSSGVQDEDGILRLRVSAGTGEAASGAASPRFILEAADSRVTGLVKAFQYVSPTRLAATVLVGFTSTAATTLWAEGAFSDYRGWPRSIAMHGQRLWFGGNGGERQRLWGSVINDIENFQRSTLDDASVSFTPAAQEANSICWLASQGPELIMGTSGDEWTISGEGRPITASNVSFQRRSRYGSEYLPAQVMGEVAAFIQRGGRKIRKISARSDNDAWSATDLMILAEHLPYPAVCGKVLQTAFMNSPNAILWCVTDLGYLLGMTYEAEQNVFGWHVHNTTGTIESIAVIYGAISDELWISVNRFGTRRIERFDSAAMNRSFFEPESLIYLDSAKVFVSETDTDTVTGLAHLEGQVVSILADGAEQQPKRVLSGQIKLDVPAKRVICGLAFTSEIQPMKIQIPLDSGVSEHKPFRVARVGLSLHSSLGGEIADAPDGRFEAINYRRVSTPMDGPPELFTGLIDSPLESRTRDNQEVVIRQTAPLPLNVGGITLKLDVYGGK